VVAGRVKLVRKDNERRAIDCSNKLSTSSYHDQHSGLALFLQPSPFLIMSNGERWKAKKREKKPSSFFVIDVHRMKQASSMSSITFPFARLIHIGPGFAN
jgi:hypothetical protein